MNAEQSGPERHYVGAGVATYHVTKRHIPAKAFSWVMRSRGRKLAPYVAECHSIFEFGVGWGWNIAGLNNSVRVGLDLAPELADGLKSHGIQYVNSLEEVAGNKFDVVLCHHVLEHVPDPYEVLKSLRMLLHSNGTLMVFVPYEHSRGFRSYHRDNRDHHLYSWNPQTLGNLVEESGYRVKDLGVQRFGYDRIGAALACRFRLGEAGYLALKTLAQMARPVREVYCIAKAAE